MAWFFSNDKPIFQQIIDIIVINIIKGIYPLGSKLPAVRELAVEAGVNPNTMQRALADIEQTGIIYTKRGDGRYVTDDKEIINSFKDKYVEEYTKRYIESLNNLGLDKSQIIDAINKLL